MHVFTSLDDLPPYASTADVLTEGVLEGTTMWAGMPLSFAANATAPAWFPEECVTTPLAHSSAVREKTALAAPLILNDPLREL